MICARKLNSVESWKNWKVTQFRNNIFAGLENDMVFILRYGKLWKTGEIEIFNEITYFIEAALITFFYPIDTVFETIQSFQYSVLI